MTTVRHTSARAAASTRQRRRPLAGLLFLALFASVPLASAWAVSEPRPVVEPPQVPISDDVPPLLPVATPIWDDNPGEEDPSDLRYRRLDLERAIEVTLEGSAPPADLPDDEGFIVEPIYPPFDPPRGAFAKTPSALVPRTDTSIAPWKTLVQLEMRQSGAGMWSCTAETLGSFHLLTAAHCVYGHQWLVGYSGWATKILAYPGQTDVLPPIGWPEHPYGEARATRVRIKSAYIAAPIAANDWAVITLDRRVGDRVGWMARSSTVGNSIDYAGYPKDGPYSSGNQIIQHGFDAGNVIAAIGGTIFFNGNTYGGMSGGPAWRASSGVDYLVGTHAGTTLGVEVNARLNNSKRQDINDWIADDWQTLSPTDRAELQTYQPTTLHTPVVVRGHPVQFDFSVVNLGYASSGPIQVDFTLRDLMGNTWPLGTETLVSLSPMQFHQWVASFTPDPFMQPNPSTIIWVDWDIQGTSSEYTLDNNQGDIGDTFKLTKCVDLDRDGYGQASAFDCPVPYVVDCDDNDPAVHPGVDADGDGFNVCDDCDDTDSAIHPNADKDGDGYSACVDCNDNDGAIHPGATEVCNGADDDCDGLRDEVFADQDSDGWGAPCDCNDLWATINPGRPELCNGVDDNCDGEIDGPDLDRDGFTATCGRDCDDRNPEVHPGATEIHGNNIDENCNGSLSCGAVPVVGNERNAVHALAALLPLAAVALAVRGVRRRVRRGAIGK